MFGLVNKAIEDLVSREYGADVWERVLERAEIDDVGFVSMDPYPDEVTYGLVGAASDVLDIPASELLEAFGRFWVLYTADEGYGELFELTGHGFEDFLCNLDNLHMRLRLSFPELKPPVLKCETVAPGSYRLHYHTHREGLAPMVVGLIKGLAERFDLEVSVAHEEQREHAGHDVFAIRVLGPS